MKSSLFVVLSYWIRGQNKCQLKWNIWYHQWSSSLFVVEPDQTGTIASSERKILEDRTWMRSNSQTVFKLMRKIWRRNHERTQCIDDSDFVKGGRRSIVKEYFSNSSSWNRVTLDDYTVHELQRNGRWVILVAFVSWRRSRLILWFLQYLISCMIHVEQRLKS